jgi:ABC-type multidrug transport system ATPase subunit
MKISLTDAGKRFNRDWIFRHLTYEFSAGHAYAIIGPNGSGKSTLLQVLSGAMQINEGNIQYSPESRTFGTELHAQYSSNEVYNYVSVCAPYLEVVEEMTVRELLEFHVRFKPFLSSVSIEDAITIVGLENAVNKQIRFYSSGMKQRVKLAQAIFSDVPVVLLDEPCTNLDNAGVVLYKKMIEDYCQKRMVVVSSNDHQEYDFCHNRIHITDWK